MSLAPAVSATLGNYRYDTHASAVTVRLGLLPEANSFEVAMPDRVEMPAAPGDPAQLDLDGGDGPETVLTGKLRAIQRRLGQQTVMAADTGADLGAFRPAVTYEKQNAKDVIRALAAEIGAEVKTVNLDWPLPVYVAHQRWTAAEHIAGLARMAGGIAFTEADGSLTVVPAPEGQPDLALRHGREIVSYEVREFPGPPVRRLAIGHGPAGSIGAPDALRPTVGALPGDAPRPGAQAVWTAVPLARTPRAANTASQALESLAGAGGLRLYALCFLLPQLRPGQVIEIQDLPAGLSGGPWLLTRVCHQLQPTHTSATRLEARSAGGAAGGLLGAALSAVGGLL
jgi:hypothetical protein